MKLIRIALPVLTLALASPALLLAQDGSAQDHPKDTAAPQHAEKAKWEVPPKEFDEVQRQGFYDGVEAARDDFKNHHPQDAEKRDEFRKPSVPKKSREGYLEGFRTGYDLAFYYLGKS